MFDENIVRFTERHKTHDYVHTLTGSQPCGQPRVIRGMRFPAL